MISESKRTYLSFAWWILEPLAMMLIYYIVFSSFLNIRTENFAFYILVSLTFWQWFHKSVNSSLNSINQSGGFISKININKLFFPTVAVYTDLIKSLVAISVLIVVVVTLNHSVSWQYVWLPIVLVVQLLFTVAIAYFFSLIIPFSPDLRVLVDLVLRGVMFASAIFYPIENLPEFIQENLCYNPIAYLLDCYRKILIFDGVITLRDIYYLGLLAIVSTAVIMFTLLLEKKVGNFYLKILMK
ncbi:ABC transporter permease [Desulfogranum marinum]|uniref:ABC transporter permease n=1 Tax=Desulfogranum marinum TaxID=453220 RepID=UPI00196635BC|nr:ABC transporter permease [Desulfogranum marinum]MBM9513032.1 ABC transporter permease [Desulfogranum marinum]